MQYNSIQRNKGMNNQPIYLKKKKEKKKHESNTYITKWRNPASSATHCMTL